jgi:thiosulfate/3-mercaptopyruvate sulfurtransferase
LLNGGRVKWVAEGRELVKDLPSYSQTRYQASLPDDNVRASKDLVLQSLVDSERYDLIDVCSRDAFTDEVIALPGVSETAPRGGHIPGAANIPWAQAAKEDSTFKSADELRASRRERGVSLDQETNRLLPHRRALEPYLVCPEMPLGSPQSTKLRRPLHRVGESYHCPPRAYVIDC